MDFSLTDEQQMLRGTASALLGAECSSTFVRAAWEDPVAGLPLWDAHLRDWMELAEGDLVDLALFAEELGRVVAPGPFLSSILAAQVVAAAGLSEVEGPSTLAIAGHGGEWAPNDDAVKSHVTDAGLASRIVVVGGSWVAPLVSVVDAASCVLREVDQYDRLRRQFEVSVPAGVGAATDPAALTLALARCTLIVAAESIGVARWAMETSIAYARDRVQFDRPIGSFQGLQWMLVDASLDVERSAAMVAYAAMCLDAGDHDRWRAVHGAKAEAGRAARHAVRTAMQVHGGVGYTWEHDLHFRFRRAYANDALFGSSTWHDDQLASLLFAP